MEIPLTKGKVAIIDDEDAPRVLTRKWTALFNPRNRRWYARRGIPLGKRQTTLYLHRFIMDAPPGKQVDHKNGDGLDCRRSNLRLANNTQNHQNMKLSRLSTTGYKGVFKSKGEGLWVAKIVHNKKMIALGSFTQPVAAAHAYDEKARELFGEFARPNFPEPSADWEQYRFDGKRRKKKHCKKGHLKAGDNVVYKNGYGSCVKCFYEGYHRRLDESWAQRRKEGKPQHRRTHGSTIRSMRARLQAQLS